MFENNQLTPFDFAAFQKLAQIHQGEQLPNEAYFDLGNGKRLSIWFNFSVDPDMAALGQLFGFHKKVETGLNFMARNYESADFTMRMYADVPNQIFTEIRKYVNRERGKAELSVKNYLQPNPKKNIDYWSGDQMVKIEHIKRWEWRPWKLRTSDYFPRLKKTPDWDEDEASPFLCEVSEVFDCVSSFAIETAAEMREGKMADFSKLNDTMGMNFKPPPPV